MINKKKNEEIQNKYEIKYRVQDESNLIIKESNNSNSFHKS